jgi:hypothetical protein
VYFEGSVLKWTAGITSRNLTQMARPFCKAFDLTWSPRGRNVWQQIQFSGVPATKKTLGPVPKSFSLRPFVRFSSFVFLERGRSEAQTLDLSPVNRRRLFGDWPVCLGLPGSRRGKAGRFTYFPNVRKCVWGQVKWAPISFSWLFRPPSATAFGDIRPVSRSFSH